MSAFPESSFTTLEHFPLAGRWTKPTHAVLPAEALARIRPFAASAAAALGREAAVRCRPDTAEAGERFSASLDDGDSEAVGARLAALSVIPAQTVVVSWTDHLAVLTEWSVFVTYWDDFCYPSSDDVSVWSPGDAWTLCYEHDEFFVFRREGPGIDTAARKDD